MSGDPRQCLAKVEIEMAEKSEALVTTTPASTTERSNPLAGVRQLAYAWVGMWGVAVEDLGSFYQRCVAHGEQLLNIRPQTAQPEVKTPAPAAAEALSKTAAARRIRPLSIFNAFGAVESYHIDLNAEGLLPTKQELDSLSERVEALAREVDALAEQRAQ
jgi:hypothetical protein